jgi:hypothetical protein
MKKLFLFFSLLVIGFMVQGMTAFELMKHIGFGGTIVEEYWKIEIQTTASSQDYSIYLYYPNSIVIDWGDATIDTYTTSGDKPHTYSIAGTYTIKIKGALSTQSGSHIRLGKSNDYTINARLKQIYQIKGISNFKNLNSTFQYAMGLTSIPENLFYKCQSLQSASGTFLGCTGITSIPENLFRYNTAVTDFSATFYLCRGITSIPENLFRYNTAVTSFGQVFRDSGITSIPENLFRYNTAVASFGQAFMDCQSLTSIPANLFQYNTAVTSFYGTFMFGNTGYSHITGNAPTLWTSYPSADGAYCFTNCDDLTNYSSIPTNWKTTY